MVDENVFNLNKITNTIYCRCISSHKHDTKRYRTPRVPSPRQLKIQIHPAPSCDLLRDTAQRGCVVDMRAKTPAENKLFVTTQKCELKIK